MVINRFKIMRATEVGKVNLTLVDMFFANVQ